MNGLLLVDKPEGWTSFDVVNKVRSVIRAQEGKKPKVGHCGTLDPFATGLLILLIGKATKSQDSFMKLPKSYHAIGELGKVSSTGDPEGEINDNNKDIIPKESDVRELTDVFTGKQSQVPHKFSAKKVDGKRAYERARKGEKFQLKPREVFIHDLRINRYEYPEFELTCRVSSGTYIRSLVEDMGDYLKTGAYTKTLRRTDIGQYSVDDSISDVEDIKYDIIKSQLIPLESVEGL